MAAGPVRRHRPAVPRPAQLVHLGERRIVGLGGVEEGVVRAQADLVREAPAKLRFDARAAARLVAIGGAEEEGHGVEYVDDLVAIVEQVRATRRAAIVFNKNSTMANDSTIDVTGEVLTALNQQLPAVTVAPLPQQTQQQQQPQGR